MGIGNRKVATVDYSVADAISCGVSSLTDLRDELSNWYDNMPESLQGGSKGDELQEAIDALDGVDSYSAHSALEETEGEVAIGGERFQYTESRRKHQSRSDRCSEACGLLRIAMDTSREKLEAIRAESEDHEQIISEVEDIESNLDELEELIDAAEGVTWPGAR